MGIPQHVCHRCRTKWKVPRRGPGPTECPKCGCTNVGPTDPAPSLWPRLLFVLIVAVAVAWKFDLLPGEAKKALDDAQQAVETTVDQAREEIEKRGDGAGEGEQPPKGNGDRRVDASGR